MEFRDFKLMQKECFRCGKEAKKPTYMNIEDYKSRYVRSYPICKKCKLRGVVANDLKMT